MEAPANAAESQAKSKIQCVQIAKIHKIQIAKIHNKNTLS